MPSLPVEPVICVSRVRIGVIAAEVIACFCILKNTKWLVRAVKPEQLSERKCCETQQFYVTALLWWTVLVCHSGPVLADGGRAEVCPWSLLASLYPLAQSCSPHPISGPQRTGNLSPVLSRTVCILRCYHLLVNGAHLQSRT